MRRKNMLVSGIFVTALAAVLVVPAVASAANGSLEIDGVAHQPAVVRGATFNSVTFTAEEPFPLNTVLSGSPDGISDFIVDDVLDVVVRHEDGSSAALTRAFHTPDCLNQVRSHVDLSPLLESGRNTVRLTMRDYCGGGQGHPPLWILGGGDYNAVQEAAPITVSPPYPGGRYVALGDSFASGEGAAESTYLPGTSAPDPALNGKATTGCHRSSTSWSYRVKQAVQEATLPLEQFLFVACSGGVTDNLYGSSARYQVSTGTAEAPQLDAVSADTRLVTLSMGGNDVGFATIVANCVSYLGSPGGYGCSAPGALSYETAQQGLGKLQQGLDTPSRRDGRTTTPLAAVYADIARRMEQGVIAVTGYPRLFDERSSSYRKFAQGASLGYANRYCELGSVRGTVPIKLRYDDALWMNTVATRANTTIEASVRNANQYLSSIDSKVRVVFVPVDQAFTYHRLCSGESWFNGVELAYPVANPLKSAQKQTSVHPNLEGQRAYAAAVLEKLRAASVIP